GFPAPAPRQPGPDTIDNATDGRFTDAVWKNNRLYWVNTFPHTYDGGTTWNDQVVVWATNTAPGGVGPSGVYLAAVRRGNTLAADDGSWRTTVARMLVDNDLPTAPTVPVASAVTGTKLGLLPKYKLAWGAATDAMSGTVQYQLEQNVDGGGFAFAGLYSSTST